MIALLTLTTTRARCPGESDAASDSTVPPWAPMPGTSSSASGASIAAQANAAPSCAPITSPARPRAIQGANRRITRA